MNKQEIINTIDKSIKDLDNLKNMLLKEDITEKKKKPKRKEHVLNEGETEVKEDIKKSLILYSLPNNDEFIEDIYKICFRNSIFRDDLKKILEAVKRANDKSPKDDIKKYLFTCLYNARGK